MALSVGLIHGLQCTTAAADVCGCAPQSPPKAGPSTARDDPYQAHHQEAKIGFTISRAGSSIQSCSPHRTPPLRGSYDGVLPPPKCIMPNHTSA
uniref:Putative secreted protein n=1 Tax=Anopheles darlingi TaxID=43151 RepID=A0A2M4DL44_ANODA